MPPPLLQLSDIALTFGGHPLLDGIDLAVAAGERVCLVGRNGSGKSTLLRIASGQVEPDRGTVFVQPGAVLRYLAQEPDLTGHETTLDAAAAGLDATGDPQQARLLLADLGLTGDEPTANLSGGEARRTAIAAALVAAPDILLLDEPTNHLDIAAIEWLEARLLASRSALVIISHDRRFLERLSRTTVWLDRGKARRVELGFGAYEAWRDERLAEEEVAQHKLDRKIVAEEHWVRYGVTARRKRNVRRMAELGELRQRRREYRASAGRAELAAAEAQASGSLVIEAKGLGISYGDLAVVRDLDVRVMRGDRLGIVGPNGAGKTTLVRLLTGALAPDAGTLRLGANLAMATLEQSRESLDPGVTLADALTGGRGDSVVINGASRHVVSYLKDFLFAPEQARSPLKVLSGGERGRLMLARALAKPSNLLVLDEPTNDLDLETLDVLEEMLGAYAGTVILISHDRDFLDRVVSSVLVPEGGGRWLEYAGGYADMLAQRGTDVREKRGNRATDASPSRHGRDGGHPRQVSAVADGNSQTPQKRKLSFKEKHALETLPARIATLEKDIGSLKRRLADPQFFARDRAAFTNVTESLATAETALAAAEDEWLSLELLRTEIEG